MTLTPLTCSLGSGILKNGKLLANWKLGYSWDSWAIVISLLGSIHISSNCGEFLFIAKYPPLKWGTSFGRFLKTASIKSFFNELLIRSALFALHISAIKVFGSNALDAASFCGVSEGTKKIDKLESWDEDFLFANVLLLSSPAKKKEILLFCFKLHFPVDFPFLGSISCCCCCCFFFCVCAHLFFQIMELI